MPDPESEVRSPEQIELHPRDIVPAVVFPFDAAVQAGILEPEGSMKTVAGRIGLGDAGIGAVDAFASDYVPPSLVEAAFQCARDEGISLPSAIAMVSDHPARMSGLTDRGRLETGMRGDLVRVRLHGTLPIVRQVWRAGERVI